MVREAERARVNKFVYVSSLGADRGTSAYHQSKRKAEAITRQFSGAWVVVRPANVYGPDDEQLSLLLRMIRTLPVLPVIGDGDRRFQPIWHEDLAEALARCVERDDLAGQELDVAGADLTSQNDLIRRLSKITGRNVRTVPVPEQVASIGARVAGAIGVDVPFNADQMKMLVEGSEIAPGRENALLTVFHVAPTPLDRGLQLLADAAPEQLPETGVGPLQRRRFWADIAACARTPEQLSAYVREHFAELMASFMDARAEPETPTVIEEDATLTLSLPIRGHMQVRVAECEPRLFTLLTLQGHPIAGAVRFLSEARGDDVRFEIQVYDRAASVVDLLMMRTLGDAMQEAAWREMVQNVVRASGGSAPRGVESERTSLDAAQAERIEQWLQGLVLERKREEAGI